MDDTKDNEVIASSFTERFKKQKANRDYWRKNKLRILRHRKFGPKKTTSIKKRRKPRSLGSLRSKYFNLSRSRTKRTKR